MALSTLRHNTPTSTLPLDLVHSTHEAALLYPLRRLVRNNPRYGKLYTSRLPLRELGRFHRQLQLRLMDFYPDRCYVEAFPALTRPLLYRPEGMIERLFTDIDGFFSVVTEYIAEVKNWMTDGRLMVMRYVPRETLTETDWAVYIAPHCRYFYLDAQKTLFLHVNVETRYIESFAREQLYYDDTAEGVEGHALGRLCGVLEEQLLCMDSSSIEYEVLELKSRTTEGVSSELEEEEVRSTRSCDRMFVSPYSSATDANGDPWPTLVIETGPSFHNTASRLYMHYAVDWWFTQSRGVTKVVLLLYFDHHQAETIIEKWVYDAKQPFKKRLVQSVIASVCSGSKRAQNQATEVAGDDIVLELDMLLGRGRRDNETDILFDKVVLGACAEGYLLQWRNLGPCRQDALDMAKVRQTVFPSLPPETTTFAPELPASLQLPQYPPFTMQVPVDFRNPFQSANPSPP